MIMAEPIQKSAAAQKNAFAGLGLQAPHPAQIIRKGGQKRSNRIILYTCNVDEPLRSHSRCVSQRRHCANAWRIRSKRAQIATTS